MRRRIAGLLGAILALVFVGAGIGAFASNYALGGGDSTMVAPTIATVVVVAAVVVGLSAFGTRESEGLENPYW